MPMADTVLGYPSNESSLQDFTNFDFGLPGGPGGPRSFDEYKQSGWGAYNPDAQASLYPAARPAASSRGARSSQATELNPYTSLEQTASNSNTGHEQAQKAKGDGRKSFNFKNLVRGRSKSKSQHNQAPPEIDQTAAIPQLNPESQSMPTTLGLSGSMSSTHHEMPLFHDGNAALHDFNVGDPVDFYGSLQHHESPTHMSVETYFPTGAAGLQYHEFDPAFMQNAQWDSNAVTMDHSDMLHDSSSRALQESPLVAQSMRSSRTHTSGAKNSRRDRSASRQLHSEKSRSRLRNHGSTQTLNSNVSSLGDSNGILTPSDAGPSMPWMASEAEVRRASDSSELAHNVEGMHLQYAPPNMSMMNCNFVPSPHSSGVSIHGQSTPDASPDQLIDQPFQVPADLASRRQRSRPTPIRPESGRSSSHNDPLTRSPHSRSSSVGVANAGLSRRTHSSLSNMNSQFRVHKLNPSPAQVSPRNVQTHLEKHFAAGQRRSAANSGTASPTAFHTSAKPSASAASASRSQADYQHEFHIRSASSGQENNRIYNMPRQANSSVPNLHTPLAQGPPQLSILVPNQHDQAIYHHGLPQSAPPNKTAFFDDSPINMHGPFAPPQSQAFQYSQAQLDNMTLGTAPLQQNGPLTAHPTIGQLPPFAPQYLFPENPSMTGYAGHGFFPSYLPQPPPPQPAVELDFKVEVGPQPKLTSTFEKCEFQHTFSNKFPHGNEKK